MVIDIGNYPLRNRKQIIELICEATGRNERVIRNELIEVKTFHLVWSLAVADNIGPALMDRLIGLECDVIEGGE